MNDWKTSIRLIGDDHSYQPGEMLSGEFFVQIDEPQDIRAVEVSVLWFTEGKGDEDMAVHYFERISNENGQFVDMRKSQQFATELPESPLSYDGVIVKIHWCVRIRVFLSRGRDFVTEQVFRLGNVPRGRAVVEGADLDSEPEALEQSAPASPADDATPRSDAVPDGDAADSPA
ncbi:MAG: hypothetical protein QF408_07105 [Pirellulales bacterium]|jgi:hypothetical protein|nr:hypothetical protein [Pirellulales bacterium]